MDGTYLIVLGNMRYNKQYYVYIIIIVKDVSFDSKVYFLLDKKFTISKLGQSVDANKNIFNLKQSQGLDVIKLGDFTIIVTSHEVPLPLASGPKYLLREWGTNVFKSSSQQ